ncbi:hypothetical protein [Propylenella binzhouense]|nr:hypothetical protein [Propylenella binzhouense]
MFLAVALTILGLGFICWLLFTLAVYALPFFAAVTAGLWAYGTGAGVLGALAVGLTAGVATLVGGQILFSTIRSTLISVALALAFAAPAAIAGYHAILGISAIGIPSETWRQVFAVVGAAVVGFTAAARLTLFTDQYGGSSPSAREARPEPAPEPLRLTAPSAEFTLSRLDR